MAKFHIIRAIVRVSRTDNGLANVSRRITTECDVNRAAILHYVGPDLVEQLPGPAYMSAETGDRVAVRSICKRCMAAYDKRVDAIERDEK